MKAKVDIDWMDKEQMDAHLDNHQESKGYHTIKAGEEIPTEAIHFSGRPLAKVIAEGNPDWIVIDEAKPEEVKLVSNAKEKKKREAALFDLKKSEQTALLGKLGYTGKVPTAEAERVELILSLEYP